MPSNTSDNTLITAPNDSVLDTKETLLHFSKVSAGQKGQKNSFIKAHYRYRNLHTSHLLELSEYVDHDDINRTIRNLRFCRSVAIVEKKKDGSGEISQTSKNCKNPHCAMCARARSTKLANRLLSAISDKENEKKFADKYFYFLTLTLRHDDNTRNEIYLKEFNDYCNKLFRSKTFQNAFQYSSREKTAGWIKCTECTLTRSGFHIHAHTIVCARRLPQKISYVESALRKAWKKITKDSEIIRLDLIKNLRIDQKSQQIQIERNAVLRAVKELFKYGTKTTKIHSKDNNKINMLAKWIIATKGQNFVNASGLFRGLEIASAKSKYDTKLEREEANADSRYFAARLSKILFNIPTNKNYNKEDRANRLKNVSLTAIKNDFVEITDFINEYLKYNSVSLSEFETSRFISEWAEHIKKMIEDERQFYEGIEMTKAEKIEAAARMKAQLKFF